MGKIVVSSMLSVDGYTEGKNGDVMAMPMDLAFADHNGTRARQASSFLFGANTFRGAVEFWPHQLDVPDMPASHYDVARRYADGIPITVVSDTVSIADAGPFRDHTRIVRRGDVADEITRLREAEGEALVFGSRTLWTHLLAHGLVDELYLMIGPKIVAGDQHAFAGVPAMDLTLQDAHRMSDSDTVLLTYATSPSA